MKRLNWSATPPLVAVVAMLSACGTPKATVAGMKVLTIEEAKASTNGTWKRACEPTDIGVEQIVLQLSGTATLISTQDYDAPAIDCSGTPTSVENVSGTSHVEADPKEVGWISGAAPVGLPDTLLATQVILTLSKAIGKTKELKLILVIDKEASPDQLYMSGSKDDGVTLDKTGFPKELNPSPFGKD